VKKSTTTTPLRQHSGTSETPDNEAPLGAKDHYQREKARRARHAAPDSEAMASARREYRAMLETNAAKGRGGRPKKKPNMPVTSDDLPEEAGADDE
jgi:hypothetical protein